MNNESVFVVFRMGDEDPVDICLKRATAKKIVRGLADEGFESWYMEWTLAEYKDNEQHP